LGNMVNFFIRRSGSACRPPPNRPNDPVKLTKFLLTVT
jgi:hypothetical protein